MGVLLLLRSMWAWPREEMRKADQTATKAFRQWAFVVLILSMWA
jgi:hypothetical protein